MAQDFYTLIFVPHAKARFRKIQVPVRLAKWTVITCGALSLILAGILVHYAFMNVQVFELHRLRAENQILRTKTQEYEHDAGKLHSRLQSLQRMVKKLGVMAGLDPSLPDAEVGGVGGALGSESEPPAGAGFSLQDMDKNLSSLTDSSAKLEEFYQNQRILLSATPSIWPVHGYLSAVFGKRIDPFTGQLDFHNGIDISTQIGTRVQAPADGVIVSCGARGAYGNAIIIDHGYGIMTQYGHLDAFNSRPGQRVHRGDIIGFVGNTGRSTGPHLHYEIWLNRQAKNPLDYILDEARSLG